MAKFSGFIGFEFTKETDPGIWVTETFEKPCTGILTKNYRRWDNGSSVNDGLVLNNTVSIIANAYIIDHYPSIRYIRFNGIAWKVTNIELGRPRIILSIGDLYNG